MAKILLRRVAGINRDQLLDRSISCFWTLEVETPPFGRTCGNLVTTPARFLVSHLPMPYPNVTKRKSPQVYPLLMLVEGVDGEV